MSVSRGIGQSHSQSSWAAAACEVRRQRGGVSSEHLSRLLSRESGHSKREREFPSCPAAAKKNDKHQKVPPINITGRKINVSFAYPKRVPAIAGADIQIVCFRLSRLLFSDDFSSFRMRFSGFHFHSLVQISKRCGFVVYPTNGRPPRTNQNGRPGTFGPTQSARDAEYRGRRPRGR